MDIRLKNGLIFQSFCFYFCYDRDVHPDLGADPLSRQSTIVDRYAPEKNGSMVRNTDNAYHLE